MKKKMLVLGITGSFASGKSTVAGMFRKAGAALIDADKIYHRLIKPGGPLYKRIVSVFGEEILKINKCIDRKKLASQVFVKEEALNELSQLTHPAVIREIKKRLSQLKRINRKIIIIDAPLLIEGGLIETIDKLIVVKINRKNQIARCAKHRGLSPGEVARRNSSQLSLAKKIKLADYVIDNNGALNETQQQVKQIWRKITLRTLK